MRSPRGKVQRSLKVPHGSAEIEIRTYASWSDGLRTYDVCLSHWLVQGRPLPIVSCNLASALSDPIARFLNDHPTRSM